MTFNTRRHGWGALFLAFVLFIQAMVQVRVQRQPFDAAWTASFGVYWLSFAYTRIVKSLSPERERVIEGIGELAALLGLLIVVVQFIFFVQRLFRGVLIQ